MANKKPPTKYDYLKKDDFFQRLSEECNYVDIESLRQMYYSLVKLMSRELRKSGMVRMPDWGDFTLVFHKQRKSRDVNTGEMLFLPPKKTIKYSPDYKLKKFFQSL